MNFNLYLLLATLFITSCNTGNLKVITDLPTSLKEVSAIETLPNSDLFWVIEDGGNKNQLIGIDKKGNIKRIITLKNAHNKDWEDLTVDDKGNIFIGDFGNNDSKRKNLVIYKIPNPLTFEEDTILAEKIYFNFPEQKKFPPKKEFRYYDVEAFFYANNHLYLFTKTRFGKTLLYKIKAMAGNYEATLLDTITLCDDESCAITSADISADKKEIVLLAHQSIWLLNDFENDDFFKGTIKEILLKHESQKEGVCFYDNKNLLITDEKTKSAGGNIYSFKLN